MPGCSCFGEAVAFGEQKICVEIRTTKATRILYLPVDGLMKDMSDCDFTLMKTNLVREMSNKIAILNLKNQILAEPRLAQAYPDLLEHSAGRQGRLEGSAVRPEGAGTVSERKPICAEPRTGAHARGRPD